MNDRLRSRHWMLWAASLTLGLAAAIALLLLLPRRGDQQPAPEEKVMPGPGSETYREMVSAFFAGVAALDVDASETAGPNLSRAIELIPEEPAAWADRGLLKLRLGDYEGAVLDLEQARAFAPESGAIEGLLGLLESRRGDSTAAIAHLRRAAELSTGDLKSRFALAHEVERQGDPGGDAEALRLLGELLELQPENLAVMLERARLATKCGDAQALRDAVARLGRLAPSWPQRAQRIFRELDEAASGEPRAAATRVVFLRNILLPTPAFRRSLTAVETPAIVVGEPIKAFLELPAPPPMPSPPDDSLAFVAEPLPAAGAARWDALVSVPLTDRGPADLLEADGRAVRRVGDSKLALAFPGGPQATPPSPHGVLAVDWNSDYRMDLVLAGPGGVKILQQKEDGTFAEVNAGSKLPPGLLDADTYGTWAADVEMDGDLDLVLGSRAGDIPVLRNNGDGTFDGIHPFEAATALRGFAWADLDGDGDQDAALIDERGRLRIYANERSGRFRPLPGPESIGSVVAPAAADLNADGILDLVALRSDGAVLRVSDRDEGRSWETAEVARAPKAVGDAARLFMADLDKNGALDVIAAGRSDAWIGMGDSSGEFRTLAAPADLRILAVADLNADGRLDLSGRSPEGQPTRGLGRGVKDYSWQVIRPRGALDVLVANQRGPLLIYRNTVPADREWIDFELHATKSNQSAIGAQVRLFWSGGEQLQEVQGSSGYSAQGQRRLHFGLGKSPQIEKAVIRWPSGQVQTLEAPAAGRVHQVEEPQ